ncbi:MAG: flotillin family protein [Deltaproteobacteria bacterium]|nr:flotillin family protein [Deltaproteobacteria bacterium]
MIPILVVLAFTAVVVLLSLSWVVKNLLYVSAPNEALIFSGARRSASLGAGRVRDVGFRVVRGGRGVRIPLLERVDKLDLSNLAIELQVLGAYCKGGIPLNVQGVANVKLPGDEPRLLNAVERFLGRGPQQIARIARETLEGNVRGVLAQLTPEQVNEDKIRFAQTLLEEAEHDMARMGLVLDTLKIQNVTAEVGYLNSIGRIRGASVKQEATIAEARMQADAAEQQSNNQAQAELAKIDADRQIAGQDLHKRMADAKTRREALIAEAQAEVAAQVAQVNAEIERQKARALQVKRQLEADVVQPAEAARRASEEAARADAAKIHERGKASAAALRALVDTYRKAGPDARRVLALQKILPLAAKIAGASTPLQIGRVTVLPGGDANGAGLARTAIGANAQIKAATGVDVMGALKK